MKHTDESFGLTAQRLRCLLNYDKLTGLFTTKFARSRRPAGKVVGHLRKDGYVEIWVDKRVYMANRLAWLYVTGNWPKGEVDHRNRVRNNNWFSNLRDSTKSQNMSNNSGHKTRKSKFVGVTSRQYVNGLKWLARIAKNGVTHRAGPFDTEIQAHLARLELEKNHHGEFSRTSSLEILR